MSMRSIARLVMPLLLTVLVAAGALAAGAAQGQGQGQDQARDVLSSSDVFRGLTQDQSARLAALGRLQDLAAGETFIHRGRHTNKIFVLAQGEAQVILADGSEVAREGPGTTLGEVELADGKPATATVRMVTPGRALVMDTAALRRALAEDPKLGYVVMGNVARKIAGILRTRQ